MLLNRRGSNSGLCHPQDVGVGAPILGHFSPSGGGGIGASDDGA